MIEEDDGGLTITLIPPLTPGVELPPGEIVRGQPGLAGSIVDRGLWDGIADVEVLQLEPVPRPGADGPSHHLRTRRTPAL